MSSPWNIIIIGSGPAGHTAALYLSRANLHPLMLEGDSSGDIISGGLLTTTKTVENFPGFPEGVNGFDLTDKFREQSLRFGTEIRSETVTKIIPIDDGFRVITSNTEYITKRVLVATGSYPNKLPVPGYDAFWHKGVSTCAVCDGGLPLFRNVPLAVVGGGDSACEDALHLSHTAEIVYLIHRRDALRASKIMVDRVLQNPKIKMVWNTEVSNICGEKSVTSVKLRNTITGESSELAVKGVFVAIGHTPNSQIVKGIADIDASGYIITNSKQETTAKGIWAAGDVQDPKYRQAITAAGSGCVAALEIERSLY